MKRFTGWLLLVMVLAWTAPAPAQSIFAKKPKPNPLQRVPELILIVKTDPDERKRVSAAEELHGYDATTFTEIVPILVDVLKNDKKLSVRQEAVNSLTKIRPVSALAGHALEKAAAEDESWRVRWQAKTALAKYHLAGYSAKTTDALPAAKKQPTEEPPLADAVAPTKSIAPSAPPLPLPAHGTAFPRALPIGGADVPPPPSAPPANTPPPSVPPTPAPPRPLPIKPAPTAPVQGPSLFP